MKVYVDNKEDICPCFDGEYQQCNITNSSCVGMICSDCPLQLIKDHDKEVRKQVCDEIREELEDEIEIMGYYYDDENDTETSLIKMTDIEHTLDQIEKGECNERK